MDEYEGLILYYGKEIPKKFRLEKVESKQFALARNLDYSCPTCKNDIGYTTFCGKNKKMGWFCSTNECLQRDALITKKQGRQKWENDFYDKDFHKDI